MDKNTKSYYDQPDLWGKPPLLYEIRLRADIQALWPDDIGSIVDVGCGGGYITNALLACLHQWRRTGDARWAEFARRETARDRYHVL